MKKRTLVLGFMALVTTLILAGCGGGAKIEGNYNTYGEEMFAIGDYDTLLDLSVKEDKATITMNYYTVESDGFLGMDVNVVKDSEKYSGKVDSAKKTITFSIDGSDQSMKYKVDGDKLTLYEGDAELSFVSEKSDKYTSNQSDFENQADELAADDFLE